jgi:Fis family transcriptional regulator
MVLLHIYCSICLFFKKEVSMDILDVMTQARTSVAEGVNTLDVQLQLSVEGVVRAYSKEVAGRAQADIYEHLLAKIEKPMLEVILAEVRHNQCKAAERLGISRGTLRKKMKKYGLL